MLWHFLDKAKASAKVQFPPTPTVAAAVAIVVRIAQPNGPSHKRGPNPQRGPNPRPPHIGPVRPSRSGSACGSAREAESGAGCRSGAAARGALVFPAAWNGRISESAIRAEACRGLKC